MWVLIVILVGNGASGVPSGPTNAEFTSQAACEAARDQIEQDVRKFWRVPEYSIRCYSKD